MARSYQNAVTLDVSVCSTAEPFSVRLLGYARQQLLTAEQQLARKGQARHQGIHVARKCIRHARAALAIGRTVVGKRYVFINAELGRFCRGLSPLRDAQALIEELKRLHVGASESLLNILLAAESVAIERRDQMLAKALTNDPQFMHRRQRLQHLAEKLQHMDWDQVDQNSVVQAIYRSEHRLKKASKRLNKMQDDNQAWHEYRRRFRRLRQQAGILAGLGVDIGLPDRHTKAESDALGEVQDIAMLIRQCGSRSPFTVAIRRPLRNIARQRLCNARENWRLQH